MGGASGDGPGGSQGKGAKAQGADAEEAAAERGVVLKRTGGNAMARRKAEGERISTDDKRQNPAREGCKEDRRAGTGGG